MLKKKLLLLQDCPCLPMELFSGLEWEIVMVESMEQARRQLSLSDFDLLAAELLPKASALQQAILELSMLHSLSSLVFCPSERLDSLSYQYRNAPILLLPNRTSRIIVQQVVDYLSKNVEMKRRLQDSLTKEKRKLQDEKLVSQAKVQLVSLCRWSEERAHQYILKTAMDHSMTKAAAARQILRKLERIVNENQKNQCHATS